MSVEERRVTIREAADICNVSADTVRRRILDNTIVGAVQTGAGSNARWLIPISSLMASGLVRGARPESWSGRAQELSAPKADDLERLVDALTGQVAEQQRIIDGLLVQLADVTRMAMRSRGDDGQ